MLPRTMLAAASLLAWLALILPLEGQQSPRVYEPFVPTAEFTAAYHSAERDYRGAAIRFIELADRYPGTTLGAQSLFFAIHFANEDALVRSLHQRVLTEYPNSRFEIDARGSLLSLEYGRRDWAGFVVAADQLAQSYGGPSLSQVKTGDRRSIVNQIQSLSIETQWGLENLYSEMHSALSLQLKRYEEALPLALFRHEAFWPLRVAPDFSAGDIAYDIGRGDIPALEHRVDPTVRIRNPKPSEKKGPRPRIKVDVTVGDLSYAQVDLGSVRLSLDGRDVTPLMLVRSHIRRKIKPNKPFERLRLKYRPFEPLARGNHTVAIVVPTKGYQGTGPGVTRVNWTFQVGRDHDDDEDSCTDQIDDRNDDSEDTDDN